MTTLTGRSRARPQTREASLLARAQCGDVAAFEELVRMCVDRLFRLAVRLLGDRGEAEEVVQETLLRAWRGIRGFRGRSGFQTWLYRIALNEAHRTLQKDTRRPRTVRLAPEHLQVSGAPDHEPAHQAEYRELRAALESALLDLPLSHRAAVVLRDIEGLSTREAAQVAGVGEAAFKSRLHQARLRIRGALGDDALIAAGA